MRVNTVPKVYRSFEEFERDELRRLDGVHATIDEMLAEMFPEEKSTHKILATARTAAERD